MVIKSPTEITHKYTFFRNMFVTELLFKYLFNNFRGLHATESVEEKYNTEM